LDKQLISLVLSAVGGVFLAIGLWSQALLLLQRNGAKWGILLKYLGVLIFLGTLWFYPAGVILDAVVFFLATGGSLLLAGLRRKLKRYS
jgi:hypothetical protein